MNCRSPVQEFRVEGLGSRVSGLGLRVWCLGFWGEGLPAVVVWIMSASIARCAQNVTSSSRLRWWNSACTRWLRPRQIVHLRNTTQTLPQTRQLAKREGVHTVCSHTWRSGAATPGPAAARSGSRGRKPFAREVRGAPLHRRGSAGGAVGQHFLLKQAIRRECWCRRPSQRHRKLQPRPSQLPFGLAFRLQPWPCDVSQTVL